MSARTIVFADDIKIDKTVMDVMACGGCRR